MPDGVAFEDGVKRLNAHLWTLMATAQSFKSALPRYDSLNGLPLDNALPVIFSGADAEVVRKVRVQKYRTTEDIRVALEEFVRFLPDYLLFVARAEGEYALHEILVDKKWQPFPDKSPRSASGQAKNFINGNGKDCYYASTDDKDYMRDMNTQRNEIGHEGFGQRDPLTPQAAVRYIDAMTSLIKRVRDKPPDPPE